MATIIIFILNMVLHPEFQESAQQELDQLLGGQRLPTFEDKAALPSIERIVFEAYRSVLCSFRVEDLMELLTIPSRWSPLAPLGTLYPPGYSTTQNCCHLGTL
jgi:hypothetical protein